MSGFWLRSPVLSLLLLLVLVLLLLLSGFRLVLELEGVTAFCRPLLPCGWSALVLVLMVCLVMLGLLLV